MILADKIIRLRKKNGWSQEELADKMNVSRQAVSKWEGAQTIPDLEKILQLGVLFGVTTDYLLKDEIEDEEFANDNSSDTSVKKITIEEANSYLEQRKRTSWQIALATFFCILSPIALIVLSVFLENQSLGVTIGLVALFAFVLCAIPIYIYCGFKNEPYAFLDKNIPFELEYGVKGLVTEAKKKFRNTYVKCNIIAACICIFSPLPLVVSAFSNNETILIAMINDYCGNRCVHFHCGRCSKRKYAKTFARGRLFLSRKKAWWSKGSSRICLLEHFVGCISCLEFSY